MPSGAKAALEALRRIFGFAVDSERVHSYPRLAPCEPVKVLSREAEQFRDWIAVV